MTSQDGNVRTTRHVDRPAAELSARARRGEVPQFTLGGLFAFATATAVCMSLAMTAIRIENVLLLGITALGAWIVLCQTYRKLRLRTALVFHWLGPGAVLGALLGYATLVILVGVVALNWEIAGVGVFVLCVALPMTLLVGAAIGCLFSLPIFVVSMILVVLRAAFRRHR